MKLLDLLLSPWAIDPARLLEIQEIYTTHLKGDKIDLEAIEARLGRPLSNEQQEYALREGGIAVLPVSGVIAPKANMFTRISGGASAEMLSKQIESMRADPRVRGAVLDFDTPGGSVFGIPAMAAAIRGLSQDKPTVAVSTGMMASAGYWTGSAANAVYISGETDHLGSIGVVATHNYQPRSSGVQTTEITAGAYKRIVSDTAPLTKEGRAYLQAQVDEIYRVFVDSVATNRRVSAEQVLEHMADGRTFIGQQAIDAGLADGIATVDDMVERMATSPEKFASRRRAVFAVGGIPSVSADMGGAPAADATPEAGPVLPEASTQPEDVKMTDQEKAEKFAAENPQAHALVLAAGAAAERARIQAVREQAMPGHEALIDKLAMDGTTSGPEAAVQVLAAERVKLSGVAGQRAADAPKPVVQAAAETDPKADDKPVKGDVVSNPVALDKAAREFMAANPGTNYLAAVKAVSEEV